MENSVFNSKELVRWNTLKYVCVNDPDTFKDLLTVVTNNDQDNVLNGVVDGKNLFFIACESNSESVKHLLEYESFTDENINADDHGTDQTALRVACGYNQPQTVKYLLKSKRFTDESINKVNFKGNTALIRACGCQCGSSLEMVRDLMESDRLTIQTINMVNVYGASALHYACLSNSECVKYLLDCEKFDDSHINRIDVNGVSVLHLASHNHDPKSIEYLILSNKLTVSTIGAINNKGLTALDIARERQPEKLLNNWKITLGN